MMRGMLDVASVTSTICDLFGIPRPADCVAPPFSEVAAFAARRTVTKALVFAADAIGAHLIRSYPKAFEPVARHAPTSVEACAVMPSVTPVCFASMFTGAPPDTHGIRKSERPTLTCDTLFDARPGDPRVRGRYRGHVMKQSWSTAATLRPIPTILAVATLGAGIAYAIRNRRDN